MAGTVVAAAGALLAHEPSALPAPSYGSVPRATAPVAATASRSAAVIPADRLPVRLTISRLSIDAGVVPVGVGADRSLMLPEPRRTGWWIGGAQPGDRQGTVVIAGHVDAADGSHGALYPLTSLRTGDDIQVGTTAGPVAYHVVAMRSFFKQRLPTDLFSRSGAPRLVLITCGGRYQPGSGYTKNVVAYAVPG